MARASVKISENGPRSEKFGHPCPKCLQTSEIDWFWLKILHRFYCIRKWTLGTIHYDGENKVWVFSLIFCRTKLSEGVAIFKQPTVNKKFQIVNLFSHWVRFDPFYGFSLVNERNISLLGFSIVRDWWFHGTELLWFLTLIYVKFDFPGLVCSIFLFSQHRFKKILETNQLWQGLEILFAMRKQGSAVSNRNAPVVEEQFLEFSIEN